MMNRASFLAGAAFLAAACGQEPLTSGVPFSLSLGRIEVERFSTGPCSSALPCYAIGATLAITAQSGLAVSDVRAELVRPDGMRIASSAPLQIPHTLRAGETANTHLLLVTTPGVLDPGTVVRATVLGDGHEVSTQAAVPLP